MTMPIVLLKSWLHLSALRESVAKKRCWINWLDSTPWLANSLKLKLS